MSEENTIQETTKPMAYDALLATGRVYIVKVSGGRYEDSWEEIEGVFSTLKKAKNYRKNRAHKKYSVDKEHTVEILTLELDKPCC